MSGIFKDVMGNLDDVQQKLLGPDYKYYEQIKTPTELGVTSDGGLDHLSDDVSALIAYVELLVSGTGEASATGNPLGNKFFLHQTRYFYTTPDRGPIRLCEQRAGWKHSFHFFGVGRRGIHRISGVDSRRNFQRGRHKPLCAVSSLSAGIHPRLPEHHPGDD